MNKSRKKLLMSSMAMLLVSAMALSTATYAWFTSLDEGSVTEIEFTATAGTGIQLSADALDWKTTLPFGEIKTAQTGGSFAATLKPYSTGGAVTAGKMDLFLGTLQADNTLKAEKVSDDKGDFYRFDVYVKNDGEEKELFLDLGGSKVEDHAAAAIAKTETTAAVPAKLDTGLSKAVRIAFIDQGQGVSGDNTTQTPDLVKAAAGGTASVIWEPNATTHNSYAQTYRYQVDATSGKPSSTAKVLATADNAEPYVAIIGASTLTVEKGAAIPAENCAEVAEGVVNSGTETKVATLAANQVTKLTIYIWLEGQDVDCNNAESGGTVLTTLKFNAKAKTVTP